MYVFILHGPYGPQSVKIPSHTKSLSTEVSSEPELHDTRGNRTSFSIPGYTHRCRSPVVFNKNQGEIHPDGRNGHEQSQWCFQIVLPTEARPQMVISAYTSQTSRLRLLAINDLLHPEGYTENLWNCYMLLRRLLEHKTRF